MKYYKKKNQSGNLATVYLCHKLIENNIPFDVEYTPGHENRKRKNKRGSRFDIVIIKNDNIIAIIETKPQNRIHCNKQLNKYEQFNLPVILCAGLGDVDFVFKKIEHIYYSATKPECYIKTVRHRDI